MYDTIDSVAMALFDFKMIVASRNIVLFLPGGNCYRLLSCNSSKVILEIFEFLTDINGT